jgi:hypothetical protein
MSVAELSQQVLAEKELARELEVHAGEWVAVKDHRIVANAPTLAGLVAKVDNECLTIDGMLQVPEGPSGACFF